MEAKTRKILFITCGTLVGVAVLCCVAFIIVGYVYGPQIAKTLEELPSHVMEMSGNFIEEAFVKDLPEGVDEQQVRQLVRTVWNDLLGRMMNQEIDQQEFEALIQEDFQQALEDEEVTPTEFENLVDRFHEVVYQSSMDPGKIQGLKDFFRQAKDDGDFDKDEVNALVGRMNDLLIPPRAEATPEG